MLCVLPVHAGDCFLLLNLLRWLNQLGGCPGHSALIVADANLSWPVAQTAVGLAEDIFDSTTFITNGQSVTGWIPGSNSLWQTAAQYCSTQNITGWFWLEPDAVPLRPGWLDCFEKAWAGSVADFLAAKYPGNRADCPSTMMTGIAVYPSNAIDFFRPVAEAFDIQLSRTALDFVEPTPLIQQFWGQPGLAPTFRLTKSPGVPKHAFTLAQLDPAAVIFHRNKDGSLIELLRAQLPQPSTLNPQLLVVLPVCSKDSDLMLKCLGWITELDGQNPFDCLISHDSTVGPARLDPLRAAARRAFRNVHEFTYPRPVRETPPDACTMGFVSTAQHIQAVHHRPWLWLEADCVPLKPNWLPTLALEYRNCGQPVMGPVVPNMGHMNGTAIYPADFPTLSPRAMAVPSGMSWDCWMTPDLVGRSHDCSRLWCHAWGLVDGRLHPHAGPAPHFSSTLCVDQWIPADCVIFHRCKDGSLIDQLRAKKAAQKI